jgi:(p)ppGpp synthase/HD superfamily hydrolase
MARSVHAHVVELRELLAWAQACVEQIEALDGARNPFSSLANNATLHDCIKRMGCEADALTKHFGSQIKRQQKGTSK